MKRHRSHLPSRSNCLGATCGTNIDLEGIDFSNQQSNLVYMDKVFSFNQDTSCPILLNLNTGGNNRNNFIVEFTLEGNSCNLVPCTLSENAVFNIEKSFVAVEYFNTRPPGNIHANQVTLNDFPVDDVSYSNGQYTAKTSNVITRVQKERCFDRGLPTKAFFLIENAGPWDLRARYILEGTVNTGGRICCFKAEIFNSPNSSNTPLPPGSKSSFAVPNLSLPCTIDGIAPDILFQFNANVRMVNPRLVVNCGNRPFMEDFSDGEERDKKPICCCCCNSGSNSGNNCTVSLVTTLAVEPVLHVETVRRTLFCTNACEALKPCDGSILAAEEEEDEECELQTNPCSCGRGPRPDDDRDHDRDNGCRNQHFEMPCGNRTLGGITIGTGDCNCNDGRRPGRDCRGDLEDALCDLLANLDCVDSGSGGDCSHGIGTSGTMGCQCSRENSRGSCRGESNNNSCSGRVRSQCGDVQGTTRTAFQFNGTNGCSW